jgi:hypothetical protein
MSMPIELTEELRQRIVSSIRAGGYPAVAALAWGVPSRRWRAWLRRGRRRPDVEPYGSLYREVEQAEAQARLKAEVDAYAQDARFWLKNGPGKDTGAAPGWDAGAAPAARGDSDWSIAPVKKMLDAMRLRFAGKPELCRDLHAFCCELYDGKKWHELSLPVAGNGPAEPAAGAR